MEVQITLNNDEIIRAIKFYVESVLNEKVAIHKYYKTDEIQICHVEDDRVFGVFNYYAYVKTGNKKAE